VQQATAPSSVKRKLAAILSADVKGYSRLMAADEEGTLRILNAYRQHIDALVAGRDGRIVGSAGDSVLAEFPSAVEATRCAVEIQQELAARNGELPKDRRLEFRIGINLGDVMVEGDDLFGDGVNVAARLQALAEPGGIYVSGGIYDQIKGKLPFGADFLGEQTVKNIAEPVRVYRLRSDRATVRRGMPRRWRTWLATAAGLGLLVILAAGTAWYFVLPRAFGPTEKEQASAPPLPDRPSIAVLPFDNLSDIPEEEYFADGLTDDLITDLSKISGLFIIARDSAFAYKDQPLEVREVARELGVRYVLEGSVRRAGERVRINAQLIDGNTGGHIWAERYERDYADIFAVQDQVLKEIVGALSVQLTEAEQTQVNRLPTRNLEAYDYYLRAEQEVHRPAGEIGLLRALELYQKAISLDAEFADAYAGHARAALILWTYTYDVILPGTVARQKLYEAAGRALALNPELPRARAVLAEAQSVDGAQEAAIESARLAVAFGPSDAEAHATLALVLAYAGQPEQAVEAAETALRLNPKPPASVLLTAGLALLLDEQYDGAIEALEQARDLAPGLNEPIQFLTTAYGLAGRSEQAKHAVEVLLQRTPSASVQFYRVIWAHHRRPQDLARRLDGLRKAGLPEWPYDYPDRPEQRLDDDRVRALTFGHMWQGQHSSGEPFLLQIGEDGTTAYRSPSSLRTGMLSLRENRLCDLSDDFLLGRPNCGYLYHDRSSIDGTTYEYVYVNAFSLMHFSVAD
jgi:TolB-like protein/class 3 adenylate cyclase/Flp pilus assembly protein TadD